MKRDPYDWATEKEPGYSSRPRPVVALTGFGSVKTYITRLYGRDVTSRCSVCEKPSAGVRCRECQAIDARRVGCECLWLGAGEKCACKEAA